MGTVTMIAQLLLALSILIILHEWGHYQTARWFGIRVEKFFLFFDAWGTKLFSFKKGDTEYGVGWLPLGGYVKISGMIDESMDKEFLDKEPEDYEFRSKPVWQRLIVMIGGVTVNIILGVVIYSGMKYAYGEEFRRMDTIEHGILAGSLGEEVGFKTGDEVLEVNGVKPERFEDLLEPSVLIADGIFTIKRGDSIFKLQLPADFASRMKDKSRAFIEARVLNQVDTILPGKPAEKAGLQVGDIILTAAGKDAKYFHQISPILDSNKDKSIVLVVNRQGIEKEIKVDVLKDGTIGFGPKIESESETYGIGTSIVKGTEDAFGMLMLNIKGFKKIFNGDLNLAESVAGPIGMAKIFGSTWNWRRFWGLTGALSMILAFMNILPIPALDGGHVFFLLIEWVRGKPLSDKALERAQIVGFVILLTLMVLIFGNDIYGLIIGR